MKNLHKILIHSIVFSPDSVSTAYLYNDIALAFHNEGYEVTVLTTTPHYNIVEGVIKEQPLKKKLLGLFYTSNFYGIRVIHVPQKKFKSTIFRVIGFAYWHLCSLILGLLEKNISIILSPSPPLSIGFVNLLIGKVKSAKVVYNVQEIYPDLLIEQGGLRSKYIINFLRWMEHLVYKRSDAVTTIDDMFYKTIVGRFEDPNRLYIIPNFVKTELYRPIPSNQIFLNHDLFPESSSLKVMYAGNIGYAQDWDPFLKVADLVRDEDIEFYVIGEGVMKYGLSTRANQLGLKKVHILPYQPRESMPYLLAFSDLQFIFMAKEIESYGFPSKVYTIMACGKPLIVCSGEGTPIVNFLRKYECAKLITSKSFDEKVLQVVAFLKRCSKNELKTMGESGFSAISQNYTKSIVTQKYLNLINNLCK